MIDILSYAWVGAGTKVQDLPLSNTAAYAVSCAIEDPYIVVLMNDGSLRFFTARQACQLAAGGRTCAVPKTRSWK